MVKNKKLTEEEFLAERKEVLAGWRTGSDPQLDLDKAVAFLKSIPDEKNFAKKLAKAKANGSRTLVQPRAGDILNFLSISKKRAQTFCRPLLTVTRVRTAMRNVKKR